MRRRPYASFATRMLAALRWIEGIEEKRLDKNWHPVENDSRALSAFPSDEFFPLSQRRK
jgi:hypothetical protein